MDKAVELLLTALIEGGPGAIISILIALIGLLLWYVHKLIKSMQEQSKEYKDSMTHIIDKYQTGQINVIEALNEIKIILAKIEVKV